jgi:hypothetical protein
MSEINNDLKDAKELEVFAKSAAGKVIVASLKRQTNGLMSQFVAELANPNLNRYIALSCELKEKLDMIRKFEGAGDIRKIIEESMEDPDVVA